IVLGVAVVGWLQTPRLRRPAQAALAVVFVTTAFWAGAYTNVYRQEDTRVEAARWIAHNVPYEAKILLEPTHNTPPLATYRTKVDFYGDHVLWTSYGNPRGEAERHDYYHMYGLDVY